MLEVEFHVENIYIPVIVSGQFSLTVFIAKALLIPYKLFSWSEK